MRLALRRELRDATGGRYPAPGPGDHACSGPDAELNASSPAEPGSR
jgi:hypothetical protein